LNQLDSTCGVTGLPACLWLSVGNAARDYIIAIGNDFPIPLPVTVGHDPKFGASQFVHGVAALRLRVD
jgi:hypothetical protein